MNDLKLEAKLIDSALVKISKQQSFVDSINLETSRNSNSIERSPKQFAWLQISFLINCWIGNVVKVSLLISKLFIVSIPRRIFKFWEVLVNVDLHGLDNYSVLIFSINIETGWLQKQISNVSEFWDILNSIEGCRDFSISFLSPTNIFYENGLLS